MKNIIIALLMMGYITLHIGYTRALSRVNVQFNVLDKINKELIQKYERCHRKS